MDNFRSDPVPKVPSSTPDDFQVLGKQIFENRRKVRATLPVWLAYPTVISNDINSSESAPIEDLSYLNPTIKANLAKAGVKSLFPVQDKVIPFLLESHSQPAPFWPRDICVSAPTGSGKTLAFAVPIIQLLLSRTLRKVQALVILPVQELAEQVASVFKQICTGTKITSILLSTSTPLGKEKNLLVEKVNGEFCSNVDIVITTAGRLVEHLHGTEGFSLKSLKFLVIDEADRVMDQIQNDWLYHLNKHVQLESESFLMGKSIALSVNSLRNTQRPPHKLLFSATLSQDPEKIQKFKLFHPKLFTSVTDFETQVRRNDDSRGDFVGRYTTPVGLTEKYCMIEARLKPLTLYALLKENNWKRFLCFTNTADNSHRLSFVLQNLFGDEMVIEELSSTLNVNARKAVMHKFATFKVNGIISTDALARGIDIPAVDVVISYDAPKHIKTYVHRVGRTARAGQIGTAVTLLEKFELKPFQKRLAEAEKFNVEEIKTSNMIEETRALDYANILRSLQKALQKEQKLLRRKSMPKEKAPTSLLDQIKQQIHQEEDRGFGHHIPESWKEEVIQEQARVNANRPSFGNKPNKRGQQGGRKGKGAKQFVKKA